MPIKLKSCFYYAFEAPSQPPGNVMWNVTDSRVILSWEEVKAMENESEVTGYKVSGNRPEKYLKAIPSVLLLVSLLGSKFRGCTIPHLNHLSSASFL